VSIPGAGPGSDAWFAERRPGPGPLLRAPLLLSPGAAPRFVRGFEPGPMAVPAPPSQGIAGQQLSALEYL